MASWRRASASAAGWRSHQAPTILEGCIKCDFDVLGYAGAWWIHILMI